MLTKNANKSLFIAVAAIMMSLALAPDASAAVEFNTVVVTDGMDTPVYFQ